MKRFTVPALAALFLGSLWLAPSAFASLTPIVSLSATGTGDQVQLNVTGDPNESVLLSYTEVGGGPEIAPLGSTNSNGTFSTSISSGTYGLTTGTMVTILTGGTVGPRSVATPWPAVTSSSSFTLSQNALVLGVGNVSSLTASGVGSSALYISNNSNPQVVNASVNGSTITITGNIAGSTTLTVCEEGESGTCPSIFVTVEPSGEAQLSLSSNNVTVVSGQNLPITISGGSGNYTITNNSSSSVIGATINGSVLTLSTGASSGSSSITVCTTDLSECGVVTVTAGSSSSEPVSFSNSAPSVSTSENTVVDIYGPSGVAFYVSNNSNPSVVQANLSGSTLTLSGIAAGTSSVTVCASSSSCATLTATVTSALIGGSVVLSQNDVSLTSGQSITINVSGGTPPYSVTGGASSIAQVSVSGSTLTVYGVGSGVSLTNVCSAAGGCSGLEITVNPSAGTVTTPVVTTPVVTTPTVSTPSYTFTDYLVPGSQNAQVLALQQLLVAEGYMTATPNGYFGDATKTSVLKFQAAHGIAQLGVVGPSTRTALNAAGNSSGTTALSSSSISSMSLTQLQAEVESLQSELTQVLARITQLGG